MDRRQERPVADHTDRSVARDFYQPAVDQAGIEIWGLVGEFDRVVVDVSSAVRGERPGHERVAVERSEGADPAKVGAVAFVELEDTTAQAGHIDEFPGQNRVKHRLPLGELYPYRLPVALEAPLLHQVASLPVQSLLVPDLAVPSGLAAVRLTRRGVPRSCWGALDEAARLERHEDVVLVDQGYLVVDQQVPARVACLGGGERIVDLVR